MMPFFFYIFYPLVHGKWNFIINLIKNVAWMAPGNNSKSQLELKSEELIWEGVWDVLSIPELILF